VETLIDMDFLKGGYESLEVNISSQNPLRLYSSPRPKFMWKNTTRTFRASNDAEGFALNFTLLKILCQEGELLVNSLKCVFCKRIIILEY